MLECWYVSAKLDQGQSNVRPNLLGICDQMSVFDYGLCKPLLQISEDIFSCKDKWKNICTCNAWSSLFPFISSRQEFCFGRLRFDLGFGVCFLICNLKPPVNVVFIQNTISCKLAWTLCWNQALLTLALFCLHCSLISGPTRNVKDFWMLFWRNAPNPSLYLPIIGSR